jgi:hypothetical protein
MSSQSRFILSYINIYNGIIAEITSWVERAPGTSNLAEYIKKSVTPEIFNLLKILMAFTDLINLEADLSESESNGKKAITSILKLAKLVTFYPGQHFVQSFKIFYDQQRSVSTMFADFSTKLGTASEYFGAQISSFLVDILDVDFTNSYQNVFVNNVVKFLPELV